MRYLFAFLLLFPLCVFTQKSEVFKLNSKADSGWIWLDSGWKFNVGDNPDWAKADFDDASWISATLGQNLFDLHQIPRTGAIIWFRLRLTTDSTLNSELVMHIRQSGASEVYLNGKMIHQLGVVSTNIDSATYNDPYLISLSLPLPYKTQQILAIRFANQPNSFPKFSTRKKSYLDISVSTIDFASEDTYVKNQELYSDSIHIVIGVLGTLGILYLTFYLFFSSQKINLYFSLSNFLFAFILALLYATHRAHDHDPVSWRIAFFSALGILYLLLNTFCLYKMFNQKIGWVFRSLLFAGIVGIVINTFVYDAVFNIFILLGSGESTRICFIALRKKKEGAWIIFGGLILSIIFWIIYLLEILSFFYIPNIDIIYVPFALIITPLSMAIYLGYTFGLASQLLRQKLNEVEQLSAEKQQILSVQNETLEKQVKNRTTELNQSLENLKATQTQLIQSEKLASLGELTAGIAHEIQNPLNFVNNFSELNKELIEELKSEKSKVKSERNAELEDDILNDIADNEQKINHHGKRADAIVKGMLQHSRSSTGHKDPTDIKTLADEYLRLSYHGLRAKDKDFNAIMNTDFDNAIGKINIIPQDIGRVLLNLYNNAFYAVTEKKKQDIVGYKPTVSVSTKKIDNKITIRVKDNGNGIPQKVIDKIFQPFFTTKPTGQGTGLGLSMSYDIIKAHGGEISVSTAEGEFTEFTIQMPS